MKSLTAPVRGAGAVAGSVLLLAAATVSPPPDLVCTLTLDRTSVAPGALVRATITVRNLGWDSVELGFSTAQRYDFRVRRDQQIVWRWAADMAFAQVVGELTLAPRRHATWTESITAPAQPGEYIVEGKVTALGRDDLSASAGLTVR